MCGHIFTKYNRKLFIKVVNSIVYNCLTGD
jgi:hypothetical protein